MTPDELDMLESLVAGWKRGEMPLVGGISYGMMFDWLESLGIDTKPLNEELDATVKEYIRIAKE